MNSFESISTVIGVALLATAVVIATAATLVLAVEFVLLIFLGILFGVFLTKTSELLSKAIPVTYAWTLTIVTTTLVTALIAGLFLFGSRIEDRLNRTSQQLDRSASKLEQWLNDYPIATGVFRRIPFSSQMGIEIESSESENAIEVDNESKTRETADVAEQESENETDSVEILSKQKAVNKKANELPSSEVLRTTAGKVLGALGRLLVTTFGLATNVGVVFFIGIFLAINPSLYRDGAAQLFPPDKRIRASEVMDLMGESMFNWLQGRFLSMLITGAGTSVALLMLGVPMPITIGFITGLLTFIPNIGAIVALGLAMLMGLSQGPMTVVWVVVLYAAFQLIESNIVTPLIQQHQTSIPPALLLAFQILMAALTGILGVMVATPMLAAGIVLVKEVWIKDTLEG